MRIKSIILVMLVIGGWACNNSKEKSDVNPLFMKNIKFNHLFVVIDDTTYNNLFDSLLFFNEFSYNSENQIDAGEESWTGKYIFGKHNYLEIFKPGGSEEFKIGDVGFGFMTNKTGTLDSLYSYWKFNNDSVKIESKDINNENGDTMSWFRYISIPNKDSLQIDPWLMENTKEHMIRSGFANDELLKEIEYWDYVKRKMTNNTETSPDSVKFNKLFGEVTSLHLTLSQQELDYLEEYLLNFGFTKKNVVFLKDNFKIIYSISESNHFILNQIDFSLLDSLPKRNYSYRNLEIIVNGNKASLKLN